MSIIWTEKGKYSKTDYASENDLEDSILQVKEELFGKNRIYLPVKKKIGKKGGQQNIPDGYLIDLSDSKPRLFVVENELASHEPLRHVAVQILQFSISFEAEPRKVKTILFNAIEQYPDYKALCEKYVQKRNYRNLDHLLDFMVYEGEFAALVIIDELESDLENVLVKKFKFGVEVLELLRFENEKKEKLYFFDPFLADLSIDSNTTDTEEIDTVVVPAREEGFQEVFLDENRWYAIRINGIMRPQIKYIAAYQAKPISAITYIAPVKSIEPWKDTGKVVVNFSEPAEKIGPIALARSGRVKGPQNLRYTSREKLLSAKNLDELW